jgi:hypothetical protein
MIPHADDRSLSMLRSSGTSNACGSTSAEMMRSILKVRICPCVRE